MLRPTNALVVLVILLLVAALSALPACSSITPHGQSTGTTNNFTSGGLVDN